MPKNPHKSDKIAASTKNYNERLVLRGIAKERPSRVKRLGRGMGKIVVAAMAIAAVGEFVATGVNHATGSNIPTSERNMNTQKFKYEIIPPEGAFDFAHTVDPTHDPRNGVQDFTEQLGHDPNPGDLVVVPK